MGTGVCLLFSLNLVKYIKLVDGNYEFDYDKFRKAVAIAVRFADNVNDISRVPLDDYEKAILDKRRIGLGVLSLGSLHYILGIKFGSKESLELIENIFKTKCETELLTSARLGAEKGSFRLFDKDFQIDISLQAAMGAVVGALWGKTLFNKIKKGDGGKNG